MFACRAAWRRCGPLAKRTTFKLLRDGEPIQTTKRFLYYHRLIWLFNACQRHGSVALLFQRDQERHQGNSTRCYRWVLHSLQRCQVPRWNVKVILEFLFASWWLLILYKCAYTFRKIHWETKTFNEHNCSCFPSSIEQGTMCYISNHMYALSWLKEFI